MFCHTTSKINGTGIKPPFSFPEIPIFENEPVWARCKMTDSYIIQSYTLPQTCYRCATRLRISCWNPLMSSKLEYVILMVKHVKISTAPSIESYKISWLVCIKIKDKPIMYACNFYLKIMNTYNYIISLLDNTTNNQLQLYQQHFVKIFSHFLANACAIDKS